MEFPLDKWIAGESERKKLKPEMIQAKLKNQGGRCMYCGIKLTRGNMEADHKKSLKNGGSSTAPANIQLLCRPCNKLKGSMNDKPFRRMYMLDRDSKMPPSSRIPYSHFDKIKANRPKPKKKDPYNGY
jgi:5-methylcytosine-specific restriction endonuclease McrA